ncbi:MAG: hypothetical protein V1724_06335 [Chloroflexota bacterium]
MGTHIFTETTCQGCGEEKRREGEWEGVPPVGWLSGDFQIADEPTVDGGYQAKQEISVDALCVDCGDKLLALLGVKRKRHRKERDSQIPGPVSWGPHEGVGGYKEPPRDVGAGDDLRSPNTAAQGYTPPADFIPPGYPDTHEHRSRQEEEACRVKADTHEGPEVEQVTEVNIPPSSTAGTPATVTTNEELYKLGKNVTEQAKPKALPQEHKKWLDKWGNDASQGLSEFDAKENEGDCGAPECPVHHGGSAPYCPLDFDAAAQRVGTDATPLTEKDIRDAVGRMKTEPPAEHKYTYVPAPPQDPNPEYVLRPAIIMPRPVVGPSTTTVGVDTGDDPNALPNTTIEQASGTLGVPPNKHQRRHKFIFPSCILNPEQHQHERQLDGSMVCLAPVAKPFTITGTFKDVQECWAAVGPHRHENEGDTVTCLAPQEQYRKEGLPVPGPVEKP